MQGCTLEVATLATNFAWLLNNSLKIPKDPNTINIKLQLHNSWHIQTQSSQLGLVPQFQWRQKGLGWSWKEIHRKAFFIKTYNAKISYGVKCPVCTYEDCKWLPSWILLGLIATESSAPRKLKLTFFEN